MTIPENINKNINRALDFKRDDDLGYMLTDCDIVNGILLASNEPIHYTDAEEMLKIVRSKRKNNGI